MLFHLPHESSAAPRRGIVLLVVIAMLTIFAVVGVAFVYYADAERTAAKYSREATEGVQPSVDPENAFAYFLQQLIYGCSDGGRTPPPAAGGVGSPIVDTTGVFSALRGHELLRNMYGWNYIVNASGTLTPLNNTQPYNGTGRLHTGYFNAAPPFWYGFQSPFYFNSGFPPSFTGTFSPGVGRYAGIDDYYLINYQYFKEDGFVHDPERLGQVNTAAKKYTPRTSPTDPVGPYVGGFNPSWTYPDMSNIFLAAIKADGTLLVGSFDRSRWMPPDNTPISNAAHVYHMNTMNPFDLTPAPGTPGWTGNPVPPGWRWYLNRTPAGSDFFPPGPPMTSFPPTPQPWLKYEVLRPRPADQLKAGEAFVFDKSTNRWRITPTDRPYFPAPLTTTGDVQNARGWTGVPDSFWMYLGSPVLTLPDGRQYTMLYAPLIVDLDGRINVNVAGNIRGYNPANPSQPVSLSNQGWGLWEVNLGQVLNFDKNAAPGNQEWINLFRGVASPPGMAMTPGSPMHNVGRYGPDMQPNGNVGAGNLIPLYSQVDTDAGTGYTAATGALPTQGVALPISVPPPGTAGVVRCYPIFPAGYENGVGSEPPNHPMVYNPNKPQAPTGAGQPYDRKFAVSNMDRTLRYGGTGSTDGVTSELWQLLPQNIGNLRNRQMITVLSADRDQPGVQPAFWLSSAAPVMNAQYSNLFSYTALPTSTPPPPPPPLQGWTPAPTAAAPTPPPKPQPFPGVDQVGAAMPPITDFAPPPLPGTNDWRNPNAALHRLDLNNPSPRWRPGPLPDTLTKPPKSPLKIYGTPYLYTDFPLVDYPIHNATSGLIEANPRGTPPQVYNFYRFMYAQSDRQNFAQQLFARLIKATGAYDPANYRSPGTRPLPPGTTTALPSPQQIAVLRWLAQYAVNMVDYIDNDDYVTPFNWVKDVASIVTSAGTTPPVPANGSANFQTDIVRVLPSPADWYVYGNEMPRVLINEVYAEYDNKTSDQAPPTPPRTTPPPPYATGYQVNVWVELYNPIPMDPRAPLVPPPAGYAMASGPSSRGALAYEGGAARLTTGTGTRVPIQGAYQVVLTSPNTNNPTYLKGATGAAPSPLPTTLSSLLSNAVPELNLTDMTTSNNVNVLGDPEFTQWPKPGSPPKWQYYDDPSSTGLPKPDGKNTIVYSSTAPNDWMPYGITAAAARTYVPTIWQSNNPAHLTGGFFVIGPADSSLGLSKNPNRPNLPGAYPPPRRGADPNPPKPEMQPYAKSTGLSYTWTMPGSNTKPPQPTVLLRRLLCPALPYQPDPTQPLFNPYITVDFMDNVPLNQAISFDANGNVTSPPVASLKSYGRKQPYDNSPSVASAAASSGAVVAQTPSPPTPQTPHPQPQHTFFSHNNPRLPAFDWMVHLDRPLISPMELLHVATCRPHQVTHLFKYYPLDPATPLPSKYQNFYHAGYWQLLDGAGSGGPESALRRFFELVETGSRSVGVVSGQHTPGEVNINTIYDQDPVIDPRTGAQARDPVTGLPLWTSPVFNAICDAKPRGAASPPNYFDQTNVNEVWSSLQLSRTQFLSSPTPTVGPADKPFKGLGTGFFPPVNPAVASSFSLTGEGNGIEDTIFRRNIALPASPAPVPQRLFEVIRHDTIQTVLNPRGSPIIVQSSTPHGLSTGAAVYVQGNPAISGGSLKLISSITVLDPLRFALDGTTGNGNPPSAPGGAWRHASPHPVQRYELYNKIYNQITTRSNVFAVWVTVGFFEVIDSTPGQLPKLGAELGYAEGKNVRHRMFAIIDRSQQPSNPGPWPTYGPAFDPHRHTDVVPFFTIID
jgi:hypothetical protein